MDEEDVGDVRDHHAGLLRLRSQFAKEGRTCQYTDDGSSAQQYFAKESGIASVDEFIEIVILPQTKCRGTDVF